MADPIAHDEELALLRRELRLARRQAATLERQQRMRMGAMRSIQGQLEDSVGELRQALEESRRASRAKDSLLANLSHELRTPLHGIQAAGELLADAELGPDATDLVRIVLASSGRLRRDLESLLDFARIEAGRVELDPRPVELAFLVGAVVAPEVVGAEEKGLELSVEVAPDLPRWVRLDTDAVLKALGHLVNNAVKFTKAGRVDVRVRGEGDGLVFEVEDTGCGVPAESQEWILEAFAQVETGRSRAQEGAGLGLALANRIAEAMGGQLGIESEPGLGTRVSLELPLVAVQDGAEGTAEAGGLEGAEVLIVDDNAMNLLVAAKMLERLGCCVTVASSGPEALEMLEGPRSGGGLDLVLMDCSMPEMNGYETTREIRSRGLLPPGTPIVALTAHALGQDRRRAFESGMVGFLTKPITQAELAAALGHLIRRDRAQAPAAPGASG